MMFVPAPSRILALPLFPPLPVVVCRLSVVTVMLLLTLAKSNCPAERVSVPTPPTLNVPLLLQMKEDKPEKSRVAREVCPDVVALFRTVTLPLCTNVPPPVKLTLVLLASIPGVLPTVKRLEFTSVTPFGISTVWNCDDWLVKVIERELLEVSSTLLT